MTDRPSAAPAHFPYLHRTIAQVDLADRLHRSAVLRWEAENEARQVAERKRLATEGYHAQEWEPFPNWGRPERVDRDECHKCGVRGDVGCKHVRKAA